MLKIDSFVSLIFYCSTASCRLVFKNQNYIVFCLFKIQVFISLVFQITHFITLSNQVDKSNTRLKALKRQLEEFEEENQRLASQKRKLTRDLEEQKESAEGAQRDLDLFKSKMRLTVTGIAEKNRSGHLAI